MRNLVNEQNYSFRPWALTYTGPRIVQPRLGAAAASRGVQLPAGFRPAISSALTCFVAPQDVDGEMGVDDVPPEERRGGLPRGDRSGAGRRLRGGFAWIRPPGGVGEEHGDARGGGLFRLQPHDAALRQGQPLGATAGHFSCFVQEQEVRREGLAAGVCQSEVVFEGT